MLFNFEWHFDHFQEMALYAVLARDNSYVLVIDGILNNLQQQIFHVFANSSTCWSSNLHSWLPYNDEHWLLNSLTFDCQLIGLNWFMIVFVLTFRSLMIESILIKCVWLVDVNRLPRCFSFLTFFIVFPHNIILQLSE